MNRVITRAPIKLQSTALYCYYIVMIQSFINAESYNRCHESWSHESWSQINWVVDHSTTSETELQMNGQKIAGCQTGSDSEFSLTQES